MSHGTARHGTARRAALPIPGCREGVPRTSGSKTWQAVCELEGKWESPGIKNDHFPEIKTETSHQFLLCITEDMRIPVNMNCMMLPFTLPFILALVSSLFIRRKRQKFYLQRDINNQVWKEERDAPALRWWQEQQGWLSGTLPNLLAAQGSNAALPTAAATHLRCRHRTWPFPP